MRIVIIYIISISFSALNDVMNAGLNQLERMILVIKTSMSILINKNKEELMTNEKELSRIEERLDDKLANKTSSKPGKNKRAN
ncbi:FbpB family small basic protein [Alteribacter salitolerans]